MATQYAQQDAVGTVIELTVKEDGSVLDIGAATNLKFYFKGPSDTSAVEVTATLSGDGSDGKLRYVTTGSDSVNDEEKEWKVQAGFTLGSWAGRTTVATYQVLRNL